MTQDPENPDQSQPPAGESSPPPPPPSGSEPAPPPPPAAESAPPPPAYQAAPPPQQGYQAAPPPQQGYPGAYGASPQAPYGVHPSGVPYSDKQKLVAGLLQIFLGGFGVGRFYMGDTKTAVWQIVVTVITCGLGSIWGLIDGIMILAGDSAKDANGLPLRP